MVWMALAVAGGIDRVPEDYSSLAAALEWGQGDTIVLAKGRWEGAKVERSVRIEGEPGAIVDRGVEVGGRTAGLWFAAGADGSTVDGLILDCEAGGMDAGVVSRQRSGGLARWVILQELQLRRCQVGVELRGRPGRAVEAGWSLFDLRVDGAGVGGAVGVVAYNVDTVDVMDSAFRGWSGGAVSGAGVGLAGCLGCAVIGNRFEGAEASVLELGAVMSGSVQSEAIVVDNPAWIGAWAGRRPR